MRVMPLRCFRWSMSTSLAALQCSVTLIADDISAQISLRHGMRVIGPAKTARYNAPAPDIAHMQAPNYRGSATSSAVA